MTGRAATVGPMSETPQFSYDVFLSHNNADKPRVRPLAGKLKAAGLRVWFDEWIIKPGDDIYLAIENGLQTARTLVLCLSPAALASDWVGLERSTVLFRDPSNAGRRFIPLLLEHAICRTPCGGTVMSTTGRGLRRHSRHCWRLAAARSSRRPPSGRLAMQVHRRPVKFGQRGMTGNRRRKNLLRGRRRAKITPTIPAAGGAGTNAHGAQRLGLQRGRQSRWEMGRVRFW